MSRMAVEACKDFSRDLAETCSSYWIFYLCRYDTAERTFRPERTFFHLTDAKIEALLA